MTAPRCGRRSKAVLICLAVVLPACALFACAAAFLALMSERYVFRRHVREDDLLGWTQMPNLRFPDMYGPGVYLKTNSRSFRNNEEFSAKVPKGKVRVLCSGDSMTFGFMVDNDHTWCQALTSLDPRLQAVNLAQMGYNLDQMYLWYMRAGRRLEHDIHLLALDHVDIVRMGFASKWRRPRPDLRWVGGRLVVTNFPLPRHRLWRWAGPWRLLRKASRWLGLGRASDAEESRRVNALAGHIFEALAAEARAKGAVLAVVYLPVMTDLSCDQPRPEARFLSTELPRHGIVLIDLTQDFRKRTAPSPRRFFLATDDGHYTEEGHRVVAAALYERLRTTPQTARRLDPDLARLSRRLSTALHPALDGR